MRGLANLYLRLRSVVARTVGRSPLAPYLYDIRNVKHFTSLAVHEQMLVDELRVLSYEKGIAKAVANGDTVIDLGTGTGILAFFAARKAAKVYAIEHSEIIEIAKRVAKDNGIVNVEFVKCNSRDFKLEKPADAIVHEQIGGANPFSENMIQNLLDLRERVLKKGGRIIPGRFEIYLEPIELKDEYRLPHIWELDVRGISFKSLKQAGDTSSGGSGRITNYQVQRITPASVRHLLCEPKPIMRFDLETMRADDLPRSISYENTAVRGGRVDGLCIYFKALFDDDVAIETSPVGQLTSWTMTMYRLPAAQVQPGQTLRYRLEIESILDDRSWRLAWHEPRRP